MSASSALRRLTAGGMCCHSEILVFCSLIQLQMSDRYHGLCSGIMDHQCDITVCTFSKEEEDSPKELSLRELLVPVLY